MKQAAPKEGGEIRLNFGAPNPKQAQFLASVCRYTAYGGARGGGKSWAVRTKAVAGALHYPNIKILVVRRSYPELEQTMIAPIQALLRSAKRENASAGSELASYSATGRILTFFNGATIKFGHLFTEQAAGIYQGQEYDWIFLDEATQFTEWEFRMLAATLRGVNQIPKRMYLTCNPGGVGHMWVKRLFVDRDFLPGERPEDYCFIPATVEDNTILLTHTPDYVHMLDLLPEDMRAAHRYGDWDAMAGQFFPEFRRTSHVLPPFQPQAGWVCYRSIDYGLDMFACLWVAVDRQGRAWVYREVQQPRLIVSAAAALMKQLTPPEEEIACTIAPPDLWSSQKDTGRTMAEIFAACGVGLVRGNNSRVQGWASLKEYLKPGPDGRPMLVVSADCGGLIRSLSALQHDKDNPSDCATRPHNITHICDALRYFAQRHTLLGNSAAQQETHTYQSCLCGGAADGSYLNFW
ncbi:MAG: hypothetical protein HFE97_07495 [Oscillospiraceae bacterium]|nr:hypothetical protein [Oscillospiraceae bacterium]